MKIDPLAGPRAQSIKRKQRTGAADTAFADALRGDSEPAARAAAAPGVASLDSLLSIQEAPDALSGRAKARKRGDQLLDELDRIRIGLLMGRIPLAGLRRLQLLLGQDRPDISDARVEQVLAEIETRAAVELAKLGQ